MKKWLIITFVGFFLCLTLINNVIFPLRHKKYIQQYSMEYNLNNAIVASVICAESNFNKNAVSKKGAIGLMQLIPQTAEWVYSQIYSNEFSTELLYNPQINIELGCFYLNYLSNKFENIECVLCAYNAGETVVREWLRNSEYSSDGIKLTKIPYTETNNYVKKIKNYIKVYSFKFN